MATAKPTGQIKNGLSGDLLVRLHRRLSTVKFLISPTCSGMPEREGGRKDCSLIFIHGNLLGELSDWLSPVTQYPSRSPHPSLPVVWRTHALNCTMHSETKEQIFHFIFNTSCFLPLLWIIMFILIFLSGRQCLDYVRTI